MVDRERVLPGLGTHLAFRLGGPTFQFAERPEDLDGETFGHAVVGGPRTRSYIKTLSAIGPTVGALLKPGTGELLFGVPNVALAERHVPLDLLWGSAAVNEAAERLDEAASVEQRLRALEAVLLARLPVRPVLHPVVAYGLRELPLCRRVGDVVEQAGYSHRRFNELFKRQVGLSPKRYCRMRRFLRAVVIANRNRNTALTDVALLAGYSDQPHFNREFRAMAGISPRTYRSGVLKRPGHLGL